VAELENKVSEEQLNMIEVRLAKLVGMETPPTPTRYLDFHSPSLSSVCEDVVNSGLGIIVATSKVAREILMKACVFESNILCLR